MHVRRIALGAAALAVALSATACGTADDTASSTKTPDATAVTVTIDGIGEVGTDAKLAAKLPADFRTKGTILVATNAPYQPFIDFKAEGNTSEFKGLDYDLIQAASARLGLRTTWSQQPFDGLVPGLQAGKYDVIVGGVTDKKARQQVATFVDYSASGTGFLVAAGNPLGVTDVTGLCGRKVAVQKASNQARHLADYSAASCAGKAVEVKEFPENPQAVQALLAGVVEVVAATRVNLVDTEAQLAGKVELVKDTANPNGWLASPNGFGFLKARGDIAQAYQAAVQSLIDDGTYRRILDHWKQTPIGLTKATIDQAID
ncbi:polar amino acid transport system substrate-binding protein [Allocatelliglobosispora scoriae]|uniref:Polar amino acid transport system substrate-binding protein n=1 Tax=Allocatelliglobosispora scoriae TaxID=643052 RepID=A0A841BKU9_9ACTN|nr:transporter substrate-binding domain-containing protein [Allocatelliglobosispora scoriae]MBB5867430.1 polar amino acid transport system substrate-binding protein [Allocatelliglobosispora scoriae]